MEKVKYKRADMKTKKETAAMSLRVAERVWGTRAGSEIAESKAVHAVEGGRKVEAVC